MSIRTILIAEDMVTHLCRTTSMCASNRWWALQKEKRRKRLFSFVSEKRGGIMVDGIASVAGSKFDEVVCHWPLSYSFNFITLPNVFPITVTVQDICISTLMLKIQTTFAVAYVEQKRLCCWITRTWWINSLCTHPLQTYALQTLKRP